MKVGALRHRIVILQPPAGTDSIGQPSGIWSPLASDVPADIRHPSGLEALKGGAPTATTQASIRVRYRTDVTTAMRVQHGATVYEITAVLPDLQRRQHVDLTCQVIE